MPKHPSRQSWFREKRHRNFLGERPGDAHMAPEIFQCSFSPFVLTDVQRCGGRLGTNARGVSATPSSMVKAWPPNGRSRSLILNAARPIIRTRSGSRRNGLFDSGSTGDALLFALIDKYFGRTREIVLSRVAKGQPFLPGRSR